MRCERQPLGCLPLSAAFCLLLRSRKWQSGAPAGRGKGRRSRYEDLLVQRAEVIPDGGAQLPHAAHRREGRSHGVDENRYYRLGRNGAEENFQGLDGAVIDFHLQRNRSVQVGVDDCWARSWQSAWGRSAGLPRNRSRPRRNGFVADAERRHHLIEEAVVMVRREGHDKLGVEVLDEPARHREGRVHAFGISCGS